MGEGRKDRSGKRQRSAQGFNKSSSDPELAQSRIKGRRGKQRERWPFQDGLTVDELARYRRKRVQGYPKDNLGNTYAEDEGANSISEYRWAFCASSDDLLKENVWSCRGKRPEDLLRLEGEFETVLPSYREDYKPYENVETSPRRQGPAPSSLILNDSEENPPMETETENSKFMAHAKAVGRPPLIRRATNLKREGEFYTDTETYSAYVPHEGLHRPELARRPTSLRMEGDLDTRTEKCEKFIQWLNVSRPELMRFPTNLKLEGDLETMTENHDKYVPFVGARRPELMRQTTHLKLEGESRFLAEYADVFRDHNVSTRHAQRKSGTTSSGDFYLMTEKTNGARGGGFQRTDDPGKDSEKEDDDDEEEEKRRLKAEERKEEEMKILVSKLEDLKSPPLEIPEYRDAYKDFPRERPKFSKPEDEIGRADGTKVTTSPAHSRFSTKIDRDPEYKSIYVDYPRDRGVHRKPPIAVRPSQSSSKRGSLISDCDSRRSNYEATSEVKSQYVPYGRVTKVESMRMPTSLRLEGDLDLRPEYRNAYCSQLEDTKPRKRRERNASIGRDNCWTNNNNSNSDDFPEERDSFKILDTRLQDANVVSRLPPSGRNSRVASNRAQQSRGGSVERGSARDRSTSPSYRLHVCNVDDERPRGFGVQRPQEREVDVRPYSPSFGKRVDDTQSFVVLENGRDDVSRSIDETRRGKTRTKPSEGHYTFARGRPRTPTNWMPPWYDNTNTI